jgi:hypothetical protein
MSPLGAGCLGLRGAIFSYSAINVFTRSMNKGWYDMSLILHGLQLQFGASAHKGIY